MWGFLFRQSRGIDPHLEMRRGKGAQIEVCWGNRCSSRVGTGMNKYRGLTDKGRSPKQRLSHVAEGLRVAEDHIMKSPLS